MSVFKEKCEWTIVLFKRQTVRLNYKWNSVLYYVRHEDTEKTERMENNTQGIYIYQEKDNVAINIDKIVF